MYNPLKHYTASTGNDGGSVVLYTSIVFVLIQIPPCWYNTLNKQKHIKTSHHHQIGHQMLLKENNTHLR